MGLKEKFLSFGIPSDLLENHNCKFEFSNKGNYYLFYEGNMLTFDHNGIVVGCYPDSHLWHRILPRQILKKISWDSIIYMVPIEPILREAIDQFIYRNYIKTCILYRKGNEYYLKIIPCKKSPVKFESDVLLKTSYRKLTDNELAIRFEGAILTVKAPPKKINVIKNAYLSQINFIRNKLKENDITESNCNSFLDLGYHPSSVNFIKMILSNYVSFQAMRRPRIQGDSAIYYEWNHIYIDYDLRANKISSSSIYYDHMIEDFVATRESLPIVKKCAKIII